VSQRCAHRISESRSSKRSEFAGESRSLRRDGSGDGDDNGLVARVGTPEMHRKRDEMGTICHGCQGLERTIRARGEPLWTRTFSIGEKVGEPCVHRPGKHRSKPKSNEQEERLACIPA
jgi:hypothetical protein